MSIFQESFFIHDKKLGATLDCIKPGEINLLKKYQHLFQKLMGNLGRLTLCKIDVKYRQLHNVYLQCHSMKSYILFKQSDPSSTLLLNLSFPLHIESITQWLLIYCLYPQKKNLQVDKYQLIY